VYTTLEGPSAFYFEGARTDVGLATGGALDTRIERTSGEQTPGATTTWPDVPAGDWTLTAATRVCEGNCDNLERPSDTCSAELAVTDDTMVLVTYHWGRPCKVQILEPGQTVVPAPGTIVQEGSTVTVAVMRQQRPGHPRPRRRSR
jgi:hypothetical protein